MAGQVDLDAARVARAEANGKSPTIMFGGKTFDLPPEMPFAIVESVGELTKAQEDGDGFATAALLSQIARSLFRDRYQEFLDIGPSMTDMQTLLENVAGLYGLNTGESPASEG